MTQEYRPEIDGLRAVAVILVVLFHAFPSTVTGGFVGVDVFFVISGYLITGIILSDLNASKFSFAGFYARRIRRIVPALWVVIFVTLAIGWLQLLPARYQALGGHGVAGVLFVPNFLSWSEVGYFDQASETKPLLHLWSLGVEEQFYLIWPLLLLLLYRSRRLVVGLSAVVAVSLIYSCFAVRYDPTAAFYAPWSRLWELGVGGILACSNLRVRDREWMSNLGIALIFGGTAMLTKLSPFPGLLALLPVIGTSIVIVCGSRILAQKWAVSVGLVSYPLYLWHWPLLSYAAILGARSVSVRAALVVLSLLLAALTTRFVEHPIRFGKLRRHGVAVSLAGMAAVIGFSAVVWQSGGLPGRYPGDVQSVLATMQYDPASNARVLRCWLSAEAPFDGYAPECNKGASLIWGDSHAGRLYAGLKRDGLDIAQFTRDSCPPSRGGPYENCAKANAAILRRIAELKPRTVILFAVWTKYENYLAVEPKDKGLMEALTELKGLVDDVVIVGQLPLWSPNLPTQIYEYWRANGRLPDRMPPKPLRYREIDDALAAMSVAAGVRFVSPFDALCNEQGCLTHTPFSKGELLSWDDGHLTTRGATYIGRLLHLD
ncbi:acyltransferase family protein [Bradyrhizobium sp. Pa8]|uniref:acyltransferase family protein n=1 Tax=Bradyrhizobium sp. Pa8 TaxID=3386552 RepID=UPI00403F2DE3